MARHLTQLSLDEEQYQAAERGSRKREALAHLGALRRDLRSRIGTASGDPIAEVRQVREQQSDEVLRPARVR